MFREQVSTVTHPLHGPLPYFILHELVNKQMNFSFCICGLWQFLTLVCKKNEIWNFEHVRRSFLFQSFVCDATPACGDTSKIMPNLNESNEFCVLNERVWVE